MTDFVKKLRAKGLTAQELAERWGITPRQISNIGKNPSVMNIDALNGLPEKPKSS
jgi:transcriptional regulator